MFEETPHLRTVRDWARFAVSLFTRERIAFGQGSARAWDEAAQALLHVLDLSPDVWEACLDAVVLPSEAEKLAGLLRQRVVERVPMAYLTGGIWFGDRWFGVSRDVLIPRSYYVELLPDRLLHWLPEPGAVRRILELGTGSGCLSVLLAHAYPNARIDAVDLSPAALDVARRNVARHQLTDRIRLLQGDLYEPLSDDDTYDLILTNPPYEPTGHLAALPPEFYHEPQLALDGGADGLDIVRRILDGAPAHLAPGGVLTAEVGGLRDAMAATWPDLPTVWLETHDGATAVFVLPDLAPAPARKGGKRAARN